MLIHLNGKVHNEVIEFDLPQIYFRQGQFVAVANIEIDWRIGLKRAFHAEILSTLVDKSPCNPRQQIYRVFKPPGSGFTIESPTHFLEYKLQCLDLQSSVFKIVVYDKDEKRINNSVKGVYLTLIISDAGIQRSTQRTTN